MSHLRGVTHLDVFEMVGSLYARRELFNAITLRQDLEGSPHRGTRTIFLRGPEEPTPARWFLDVPHVNYPALNDWPEAHFLRKAISDAIWADRVDLGQPKFGKIMVIELKPGGTISWHRDEGTYAETHARYHLPLVSNPSAYLYSGGDHSHIPVGVLTAFDTSVPHSAANFGTTPRIHLVVDVRRDGGRDAD